MIGIAADRLLPAAPWQAAQVTDLTAPRSSSGPAASAVTGGRTPGREPSRSAVGGLPRIRLTTEAAVILPIALATLPDFGTGRPMVASPITWTPGCFTDSWVTWLTSHQRLSPPTRSACTAIAPARWGGMMLTTS